MSAMMVSIAAWVMGALRMSCGMPVGSGVLGVVVVLAVEVVEEEVDGVVVCRCSGVVVWGEVPFPMFSVFVAAFVSQVPEIVDVSLSQGFWGELT